MSFLHVFFIQQRVHKKVIEMRKEMPCSLIGKWHHSKFKIHFIPIQPASERKNTFRVRLIDFGSLVALMISMSMEIVKYSKRVDRSGSYHLLGYTS